MSSICSVSVSIPFLLLFFGGRVLEVIWSAVLGPDFGASS
jgi:hypothetical protein